MPCGRDSRPEAIGYDRPVFELRRDPITGWWAAIVTDRTFEHASFAVEAVGTEGLADRTRVEARMAT